MIQRVDVMAARRIETGNNAFFRPRDMQGGAPAALALRIDQSFDLGRDALVLERSDDKAAFPGAIGIRLPMLDLAAAALAEMRAEGFDPLRAR